MQPPDLRLSLALGALKAIERHHPACSEESMREKDWRGVTREMQGVARIALKSIDDIERRAVTEPSAPPQANPLF